VEPLLIVLIENLVGNKLFVAAKEDPFAHTSEPVGPFGKATGDEADAATAWD